MGDPLWEDYVQRVYTSTRPADVDDWPPNERPEPEDLEAARLLGVDPRPPAIDVTETVARWRDDPILRADQVQTMTQLVAQMKRISQIMEANGAPQPKTFMVHPKAWDDLKASLEEF